MPELIRESIFFIYINSGLIVSSHLKFNKT